MNSEQGGDRLAIVQPGKRETKRCERRSVEPLHVVHRNAQRTVGGEESQYAEERRGDRALVRPALGLAEQQRDLERAPLDRRQLRNHVLDHAAEQVGQPGKREPRLRLRRPAGEDPIAALARSV
ncbi:MAG: hypothetical protein MSC30_07155 [Gaiellaceae bacterium MAG52_C11]|nr:hypothetical protein [Candidatus Gaiellasilicea maunaloa]